MASLVAAVRAVEVAVAGAVSATAGEVLGAKSWVLLGMKTAVSECAPPRRTVTKLAVPPAAKEVALRAMGLPPS